eukprot:scaffold119489_cov28-Tisochrysis_lutea.AAC.15
MAMTPLITVRLPILRVSTASERVQAGACRIGGRTDCSETRGRGALAGDLSSEPGYGSDGGGTESGFGLSGASKAHTLDEMYTRSEQSLM